TVPVIAHPAPGPEGEASLREQLSRVERALAHLDDGPREAIVLFHLEEMSYRDIAAALEVPMGTVMTWLHRGRAQLRKALEGVPTASASFPTRTVDSSACSERFRHPSLLPTFVPVLVTDISRRSRHATGERSSRASWPLSSVSSWSWPCWFPPSSRPSSSRGLPRQRLASRGGRRAWAASTRSFRWSSGPRPRWASPRPVGHWSSSAGRERWRS